MPPIRKSKKRKGGPGRRKAVPVDLAPEGSTVADIKTPDELTTTDQLTATADFSDVESETDIHVPAFNVKELAGFTVPAETTATAISTETATAKDGVKEEAEIDLLGGLEAALEKEAHEAE